MKKHLTILLFTGIFGFLSAQEKPASDTSSDDCFKQYMTLKASGRYEESDKWMVRFAELRPNDLRTKDYQLYHSDLQFLLLDNGNYTILPLKYSKKLNDKMQGRTNIPKDGTFLVIKKRYAIQHSCLTSDGKTLYFDSDMPGGFGKSDLYRMVKDGKGAWGKPENLGDKVNTEGDEIYPFYKENGRILFFSSDGHYGLGGFDIFIYALNDSGFGKVYNAGFPLNTRYDDFALIADPVATKGYFSSNREEGKKKHTFYSVIFH
jgi:hypothetical protein